MLVLAGGSVMTGCRAAPAHKWATEQRHVDSVEAIPIAHVLGHNITADDLISAPPGWCSELAGRITGALLDDFEIQRGIVVTDAEVRDAQATMARIFSELHAADPTTPPPPTAEIPASVARHFLQQWKTDRELYESYGGVVIFQQGDPFEPIGAYKAFLDEQYAARRFEIFDEQYRICFWKFYTTTDRFAWRTEEIDYSQPWWLVLPKRENRK